MSDGSEGRAVVHIPTARNTRLFKMWIGPYHDQTLAKEAGHIAGLRFDRCKRFCVCQGHIKAMNQHQILNLVLMLDEE